MCTAPAVPEINVSDAAKNAILEYLQSSGPSRPTELLSRLGNEFTDYQIKEALLSLLRDGTLELGSDRQLKRAA